MQTKSLTAAQHVTLGRLQDTDGVAHCYVERDGRLRISTCSDHDFGMLIVERDGKLLCDSGFELQVQA